MEFLIEWDWQKWFEFVATITGIICVYLQTKEKSWAWPFGIVSVSLLSIIFYNNKLLSDFILHIIFLILNIYGWWSWSNRDSTNNNVKATSTLNHKNLIKWMATVAFLFPIWGWLMNKYFDASLAYIDAFTTVGSLVAQYLLAQKVIENWIFWIVVDIICIGVYFYKDLYFVSFLFFVYLILCTYGWYSWKKEMAATETAAI